ncbi:MAG: hypothetical protein WC433_01895 [Candidatus Omnitrophota bacterium]|jgi:hypothetical protein
MPAIKRILYTNFSNPDEIDLVRWTKHKEDIYKLISEATALTSSIPGVTTDNALARWDGTDGTALNNSGVTLDDSNNMVFPQYSSITVDSLKDPADGYLYLFRYGDYTRLTGQDDNSKIQLGPLNITTQVLDGTALAINSGDDSYIASPNGFYFDVDTGGVTFRTIPANSDGVGWTCITKVGSVETKYIRTRVEYGGGVEDYIGQAFYNAAGDRTILLDSETGDITANNVVLFTHGEGNPSSTPTKTIEMYRDDTNGNCFLWNGIEWGLITLGALPT